MKQVEEIQSFLWICPFCGKEQQLTHNAGFRISILSCPDCKFQIVKEKGTWKPSKTISRSESLKYRAEKEAWRRALTKEDIKKMCREVSDKFTHKNKRLRQRNLKKSNKG